MPITQQWLLENRILIIRLYSPISTDELKEANEQAHATLNALEGNMQIHTLFDMRSLIDKPAKHINLTELTRMVDVFKHPNLGWAIAISTQKLANFVFSIFNGVFHTRMRFFHTPAEATAFLQEVDETLPPIPPLPEEPVPLEDISPTD